MTLKDLPAELRPREKMLRQGPAALADAELLALLLRTGTPGQGVLGLAQALLDRCGGFHGLLGARLEDLESFKGLGPAKRCEIAAVFEIARRALAQQMRQAPVLDAPAKLKDFVALQLAARQQEVFLAVFLDGQYRLLAVEEMFHGSLSQTAVYPREIARRALQLNAAALVMAHNHPSGVAEPSRADEHLTQAVRSALQLLDMRVLDHLVVGHGQVVSLAERGLM